MRDIKLATTEMRRNYLVSAPNYHTTKFFTEGLLAIKMRKTQVLMNNPVYLGLLILNLSKSVMSEFWYDYVKRKYSENAKLCYMDTDSFIFHAKQMMFCKDIAKDVDTSNFEIDRPLPKGKNEKNIGLMKDELGEQNIKEFVGLRAKTYSYLQENNDEEKKTKGTKKCIIKRKPKLQDYKNCLRTAQIDGKIKYLEKKKINTDNLKEEQKYLSKIN